MAAQGSNPCPKAEVDVTDQPPCQHRGAERIRNGTVVYGGRRSLMYSIPGRCETLSARKLPGQ